MAITIIQSTPVLCDKGTEVQTFGAVMHVFYASLLLLLPLCFSLEQEYIADILKSAVPPSH